MSAPVRSRPRAEIPRAAVSGATGRRLELPERVAAPGAVGIETQWLVVDPLAPRDVVSAADLQAFVADLVLPGPSRLACDPQGRLDVSTPAQPTIDLAGTTTARDLNAVRHRLRHHGLSLVGLGRDPIRAGGASAAVRIRLGLAADPALAERQRRLAADLGVVLAAACANSPLVDDAPTGWRSTRLADASAVPGADLVTVRQPGWLELRVVDALPEPFWRVPVAVVAAVLNDTEAMAHSERLSAHASGRWADAARHGLAHPVLSHAARTLFDTAIDALHRLGQSRETLYVVAAYAERFVARDRSPADDVLAAWSAGSEPLLAAATLVAASVRPRPDTANPPPTNRAERARTGRPPEGPPRSTTSDGRSRRSGSP